uniref:Protein rogdi homolog n=1 Tax=Phallusia mammillata TaxID=59560 RepID=A0A6F9DRN8_9ASCI|nr:protein rogdi homolog [Phallusia mammillata]
MMQQQNKLHQEVKWLVENEVPSVLDHIHKLITQCLKSSTSSKSSKFHLTCTTSTCGNETIRGSLILHQDTLCGMEIFMKPTKTISTVKASFRSDKQWKLQQIQDAVNHMKAIKQLVDNILTEQECIDHCAEGIVCVLDDVIKELIRCQARLATPCQLSLNSLIGSGFAKMFSPPLPGDTLVNLYVLENRLVLNYYTVQQAHTNASLSPSKNGKLHQRNLAGRSLVHHAGAMFEHAGIRYEMATSSSAECIVPTLTNLLDTASYVQTICQNLKDKVIERLPRALYLFNNVNVYFFSLQC